MLLLREQHLGLLGIMKVEVLRKQLLPVPWGESVTVLPHLVGLLAAVLEALEALAEEQVLWVLEVEGSAVTF